MSLLQYHPFVAANIPDPSLAPLPPLMTPTTSLQQAVRGNTLGIGYAGGGFMVFYFIGVSKVLQQLGILRPGHYKTAGASCGVVAQAADYPQLTTPDGFIMHAKGFAAECRKERNCIGSLDKAFARFMAKVIPPGAAKAVNNSACGMITWYDNGRPRPDYMCSYKDDADLIDAMRAATFVPGWSAPARYRLYKGRPAYDGAFAQLLPCPPNITYCVKVACLPPFDVIGSVATALDPPAMLRTMASGINAITGALGPDPATTVHTAIQEDMLGKMNLPDWVKLMAATQRPVSDIWPGKFSTPPLSPMEVIFAIFTPPDDALMDTIYKWGQADALGWARSVGWPGA